MIKEKRLMLNFKNRNNSDNDFIKLKKKKIYKYVKLTIDF
jgi:hypothetical protein